MILLVELLIALMAIAAIGAFFAFAWFLLIPVLLWLGYQKYKEAAGIRRYNEDVRAGRRTPFRGMERCEDCKHDRMPCDACIQRWDAAEPA
ncbi:hypothetical protein ABZT43_48780 [Streptomyces sp. NPDC005349]|uniref:hypothetical protein n=1 Tax=Streptomyces sp. NPDC005349 TaxID=3157037 RepID=UPI0033AFDAA1